MTFLLGVVVGVLAAYLWGWWRGRNLNVEWTPDDWDDDE